MATLLPPHEAHSQSGAKDARTPNAAASSGRLAPARSVWSACVFSAALPPTFSQSAVQGFNARKFLGNSPHEPCRRRREESHFRKKPRNQRLLTSSPTVQ